MGWTDGAPDWDLKGDNDSKLVFPAGLLIWLLSLAVWLTWTPFEAREEGEVRFDLGFQLDSEFVGHFLLLAPLALVSAVAFSRLGIRRPLLKAWGLSSLIGLILELGQWWIRGRSVSPDDVLAGVLGSAVAVFLFTLAARLEWRPRTWYRVTGSVVFVTLSIVMIVFGIWPKRELQLVSWDPVYPISVGDEFGGGRPYFGRVWNERICTVGEGGEFCISKDASFEERRKLVQSVTASQYVRLEARVWSEGAQPPGPARIVTFSESPYLRNATLGQSDGDLHLRLRTPWSGDNATEITFRLPEAVPSHEPVFVSANYDRGVVKMETQSATGAVVGRYRPGLFPGSLVPEGPAHRQLPYFFRSSRGTSVGALVFFLGLGWLLSAFLPFSLGKRLLFVPPLAAAAGLWAVDYWVLETLPPDATHLGLVSASAFLGAVLALFDFGPH